MKRNSKRFLSLFLSIPMAMSLVATPVSATVPDGDSETTVVTDPGTQENTEETAPETVEEPQEEAAETTTEESQEGADETASQGNTVFTVQDSLSTFTVDTSKIEAPEINVNEMQLTEEELDSVDESDPEIATIKEELQNIKVLNADGESVALTDEQIETVLGMYSQYQKQWQDNADVLGVQSPFYLQFNDDGEDGLGVLGEMLTLAGVSVDDVRSGNYSYDDLTGMIMNFLYGDQFGIKYYGDTIRTKRNEALQAVKDSGAQTDVQKILVLNTWLSQNNTFDMSYIMNQMGDEPVMTAPEPQQNEHYDEIYAAMEEVYRPQIEAQFQSQFRTVAEQQVGLAIWQNAIKSAVAQQYQAENPDATEEDVNTYAEQYMTENADAIATDHAPHSAEEKECGYAKALNGVIGLETAFPVSYTALVRAGHIPLSRLVALMSANPAAILGDPLRGTLSVGAHADVTVFDVAHPYHIDPASFRSKGRNTPFAGMEVYGKTRLTIAEGQIVYQDA